jgi:hypothetical protein
MTSARVRRGQLGERQAHLFVDRVERREIEERLEIDEWATEKTDDARRE